MIKEIVITDKGVELLNFRAVAVEDYGSEGCKPIYKDDCPLDGSSCISRSGDSICGGYMGHAGNHVVRCQEKVPQ
jgi:hypothetical protein